MQMSPIKPNPFFFFFFFFFPKKIKIFFFKMSSTETLSRNAKCCDFTGGSVETLRNTFILRTKYKYLLKRINSDTETSGNQYFVYKVTDNTKLTSVKIPIGSLYLSCVTTHKPIKVIWCRLSENGSKGT